MCHADGESPGQRRPICDRSGHGESRGRRWQVKSKEPHHEAQDACRRRRWRHSRPQDRSPSRRAPRSKAKTLQGVVFGGVTAQDYPGRHRAVEDRRQVVTATIGLDLKCQAPAGHHDPGRRHEEPRGQRRRQVRRRAARHARSPPTPRSGIPPFDVSAKLTGTVNKARTRIKGTWQRKVVIYDPTDPTGVADPRHLRQRRLKYTAKQLDASAVAQLAARASRGTSRSAGSERAARSSYSRRAASSRVMKTWSAFSARARPSRAARGRTAGERHHRAHVARARRPRSAGSAAS